MKIYSIYNMLRFFLYGFIFMGMIFKKKIRIFFMKRLFQKIKNKNFSEDKAILVHMSSVGEFNLSRELIDRLLLKKEKIIISIMTDTGFEAAEKVYKGNENIKIIYFPLDDYFQIKKLYKNFNIKKTLILETEIWPNLYAFASKEGELYVINGRITDGKLKSYKKIGKFIKKVLDFSKKIMTQSEEDRERYIQLGISKEKLVTHKNLKYSIKYEIMDEDRKKEYYENNILEKRKIIVCGSTRSGEEKIWFDIFNTINRNEEYQLIIVPRHLDRIEEIRKELEEIFSREEHENGKNEKVHFTGKKYSLLSENKKTDIIIVDKMGVLRDFYQMADFTFVGGTMVNIGGHSILEPLYYGKLPIIGEYYQNIEEIVKEAEKLGFIKIVKNSDEIIEYVKKSRVIHTGDFFEKNNDIEKIIKELYS